MNPTYKNFYSYTFVWNWCDFVIAHIAKMQAMQAKAAHHRHLACKPQAPKPARHRTYNWH